MLIRGEDGGEVELLWTADDSRSDIRVVARVYYAGFTGETQVWVARGEWAEFSNQLVELERTRSGEAVLNAMSPGELQLRLFTTDRLGHVAVEGFVGRRGASKECRLTFSHVAFDPTALPGLVHVVVNDLSSHRKSSAVE